MALEIEGYVVLEEIGRGGVGVVYRATPTQGLIVAVKTLQPCNGQPPPFDRLRALIAAGDTENGRVVRAAPGEIRALIEQENRAKRFDRETRLQGVLGCLGGFVPWLDAGTAADGRPFIVMPFVGGGTLRTKLRGGP